MLRDRVPVKRKRGLTDSQAVKKCWISAKLAGITTLLPEFLRNSVSLIKLYHEMKQY